MMVRWSRISLERPALAGDLLPVQVDDAQVVRLHEPLRYPGRRAQHAIVAELIADVAVIGRRESLVVDPPANLAHLLAKLPLVHHRAVAAHGILLSVHLLRTICKLERQLIDQTRAIGIHGRLGLAERVRGFSALADANHAARAGT